MKIIFSEAAQAKLLPLLEPGQVRLKLLYDTEGCGCVVSGVPALQLVDEQGPDDSPGDGVPIPFLYEPRHEVFFRAGAQG